MTANKPQVFKELTDFNVSVSIDKLKKFIQAPQTAGTHAEATRGYFAGLAKSVLDCVQHISDKLDNGNDQGPESNCAQMIANKIENTAKNRRSQLGLVPVERILRKLCKLTPIHA